MQLLTKFDVYVKCNDGSIKIMELPSDNLQKQVDEIIFDNGTCTYHVKDVKDHLTGENINFKGATLKDINRISKALRRFEKIYGQLSTKAINVLLKSGTSALDKSTNDKVVCYMLNHVDKDSRTNTIYLNEKIDYMAAWALPVRYDGKQHQLMLID